MKVKETLSPLEMDNIKGGRWITLPNGVDIWVDDDEGGEEPTIMW